MSSGRIAARLIEWHLVGGVQPLAITMNEGVCLAVEVDPYHIQRRLETGYCDEMASTLDEALHQVREAVNQGQPLSIGLIGNAAEVYPEMVRRGIVPDMVTDQTSAHDALNGYIPAGLSLARQKIHFQGLPARICWLGYGQRDKAGLAFNDLVAKGIVKAPIVIGRDHLDSGSVASPYRERRR